MKRFLVLAFACLALAACGGSSGSSSNAGGATDPDGPTSLVPADTSLYVDMPLKLEGDLKAAADKIAPEGDANKFIAAQIDQFLADEFSADESVKMTYAKDIEPWLGDRAAMSVTVPTKGDGESSVAMILQTTDTDAALKAVRADPEMKWTKQSYRGTDFELNEDDGAIGIVKDMLVIGTQAEFKRVVDTAEGGASLAASDKFRGAVEKLPAERAFTIYSDIGALFRTAFQANPTWGENIKPLGVDPTTLGVLTFAGTANGERASVEGSLDGLPESGMLRSMLGLFVGGSDLLGEMPGDSWFAFATADVGQRLRDSVPKIVALAGGESALAQYEAQAGINLENDVYSWIGDVAMFARGTSVENMDGGLVIEVTDEQKAADAFKRLAELAVKQTGATGKVTPAEVPGADEAVQFDTDLPQPVIVARGNGRVVFGYGPKAAADALSSEGRLADTELFKKSGDALNGMDPAVLYVHSAILALMESAGGASEDLPGLEQVRPYFDAVQGGVGGSKFEGDRLEFRYTDTFK